MLLYLLKPNPLPGSGNLAKTTSLPRDCSGYRVVSGQFADGHFGRQKHLSGQRMWFFNKKADINYDNLVSTLEKGNEVAIQELLWQPKKGEIKYLPVVTTMLQKLKKLDTADKGLSIFKKIEKGNYELIIFNTPWHADDLPFSPLVLDKTTGKVVGVMLPFNELHNHISKRDNSIIGDLGTQWVKFTMEYRFKK